MIIQWTHSKRKGIRYSHKAGGQAFSAASGVAVTWTSHGPIILYTLDNWSSGLSYVYEASFKAVSGTVYSRLFNLTDGTPVAGSEVTTALTSHSRKRSGAITLLDGKEYIVQFGVSGGSSGHFRGGRVISI